MSSIISINPVLYYRESALSISSYSTAEGRRTIVVPKGSALVGSDVVVRSSQQTLDINNTAMWDDAQYATAANRAGKNFYIYQVSGGGLILSANSTVPTGYTASNSRKIAGFHGLSLSVGTISGHTLTGFLTGDILPASIWDLTFCPVCAPEGMVYSSGANVWVDIYLQSGTGSSTLSVFGGTITDTRAYLDHQDDFAAVGKRMLFDFEFGQIALGSNEQTNINGSADPVTTGGHVDTASRRMISNIGAEDCCGVIFQWVDGGHIYRNHDTTYNGAWSWKTTGGTRGQQNTQGADGAVGSLAGGAWDNGVSCGSRCRSVNRTRTYAVSNFGSRGCARSKVTGG